MACTRCSDVNWRTEKPQCHEEEEGALSVVKRKRENERRTESSALGSQRRNTSPKPLTGESRGTGLFLVLINRRVQRLKF